MKRCHSCSAPLLANTNLCRYCGTRNDVDLHGKHHFVTIDHESERKCPHCAESLHTIGLDLDDGLGEFMIERCEHCFGLFFDPGEIERLLKSSVSNVFSINQQLLNNISAERYQAHSKKVKYIRCPVCDTFMRRINYGHRSGVVIDRCNAHGIWLDNGEITHLMEWKKAGGLLLHEQKFRNKTKRKQFIISPEIPRVTYENSTSEPVLLDALSSLIGKLFN
ncbi:MAG TPA: hypothetical protein DCZ48_10355 [Methylococcaceae bacterium]|nr:hypothetical protein [Methylococcaceae bacterium]